MHAITNRRAANFSSSKPRKKIYMKENLVLYICRKHRPSYESIALTPRKYWSGASGGPGWCGDAETNIPALLFPKHVLGLHASDDLAFHRDFEAVHSSSRRLANNGSNAAAAYPDILNR